MKKYIFLLFSAVVLLSCASGKEMPKKYFFNSLDEVYRESETKDTLYIWFDLANPVNYKRNYFIKFNDDFLLERTSFHFGEFDSGTKIIHRKKRVHAFHESVSDKIYRFPAFDELTFSDFEAIKPKSLIIKPKLLKGINPEEVFMLFNGKVIYVLEPQPNGLIKAYGAEQERQLIEIE